MSNFAFLARHDPLLASIAGRAEELFTDDPNTCIMKLRQFAEAFVKFLGRAHRLPRHDGYDFKESMSAWTRRLMNAGVLDHHNRTVLLKVWREGSDAVHDVTGDHRLAARLMRECRSFAIGYEATFGDPDLKPGRFVLPRKPKGASKALGKAMAEQERLAEALESSEARLAEYQAEMAERLRELEKPQVVLPRSLGDAIAELPDDIRSAVQAQVLAFKKAPDAFELSTFGEVADAKFRWVILEEDHDYVLIVAVSPQEDVLVCPWVGRFGDATEWVRTKHIEVHPDLGNLQIYDTAPLETALASGSFLKTYDDDALALCGVPRPLLPSVRALPGADALDGMVPFMPEEAMAALRALIGGATLEEAKEVAGVYPPREPVDTTDFDVAIGHGTSKRSFVRGDDEEAFRAVLDAPLEQWRVFLHTSQQRVVRIRAKGPVRVLGGAGTGKTVALLHRVGHLLRTTLPSSAKVLVTTYTRNLARDLLIQLASLLTADELKRVEVANLHKVAFDIVRGSGRRLQMVPDRQRDQLWRRARGLADPDARFDPTYVRDEWTRVVQAQGLTSKRDYWRAPRRGRGTALLREPKTALWGIFNVYRELLDAEGLNEWPDLPRLALEIVERDGPRYDAVLVDEAQDLSPVELKLLRALVPESPNDLFLVGDAHQRIYAMPSSLSAVGIHIRGRAFRLRINYRTTEAIRRFAVRVLEGLSFDDLDEGEDELKGYQSLRPGTPPRVELLATGSEESAAIVQTLQGWLDEVKPEEICLAARADFLLEGPRDELRRAGIATVEVHRDASDDLGPGVRLATMHRLKGTEFKRVLLCGVQEGVVPWVKGKFADDAAMEDALQQERCLFYVAATRARDELVVTGHGRRSPLFTGQE